HAASTTADIDIAATRRHLSNCPTCLALLLPATTSRKPANTNPLVRGDHTNQGISLACALITILTHPNNNASHPDFGSRIVRSSMPHSPKQEVPPPTPGDPRPNDLVYDCAIIGGGPAGLSAAVYMGRMRRTVLVIDDQSGRSTWHQVNRNYLGFPDGVHAIAL